MHVVVFLILIAFTYALTPDAACHFAAAQYAHSASSCVGGTCGELWITTNTGFLTPQQEIGNVSVSCAAAMEMTNSFLGHFVSEQPDNKRARLVHKTSDRLVRGLERFVTPTIGAIVAGIFSESSEIAPRFADFIALARTSAAADLTVWYNETVPALKNTDSFGWLETLIPMLIRISAASSWLGAEQHDLHVSALYFFFDFVALLGSHNVSPGELSIARIVMETQPPDQRGHYLREFRYSRALLGIPNTRDRLLELSEAIERFSKHSDPNSSRAVLALFSYWDGSRYSAVESIIWNQIAVSVCPSLARALRALHEALVNRAATIKLGVTLIDFCADVAPAATLLVAQAAVSSVLYGQNVRFGIPQGAVPSVFFRDSLPWGAPMGVEMEPWLRQGLVSGLVEEFFTYHGVLVPITNDEYNRFRLADEFEIGAMMNFRATGRAIGIAIRCSVPLIYLRLEPRLVGFLHPRMRFNIDMSVFESLVHRFNITTGTATDLVDSVHFVSAGIAEALGPGGFERILDGEWAEIFGIDPPDI